MPSTDEVSKAVLDALKKEEAREREQITGLASDAANSVTSSVTSAVTDSLPDVDWQRLFISGGLFLLGLTMVILGVVLLSRGAVTGVASNVVKGVVGSGNK